ncbi:uncharacterized protein ISCGN_012229 [Ixodes scapularis]
MADATSGEMSSGGSGSTASDGWVSKKTFESSDYRVNLPRLPQGILVLNSIFIHADITGRLYKASDFKEALFSIVDRKDVVGLGQYQMSHVWMITFGNAAAKNKLKAQEELVIKGKRCIIIDPCKEEFKLKLLWVPIPMPDSEVRKVLEPFGKVKEMKTEKWRFSGLEDLESTTLGVTLALRQDLTVDKIPHILNVYGSNVLVVIPGRPPLCLRCKAIGHIRRQCRTPLCHQCWRYGHTTEECVVTYASKLQGNAPPETDHSEHLMDVEEMCNEERTPSQATDDHTITEGDNSNSATKDVLAEQKTSVEQDLGQEALRAEPEISILNDNKVQGFSLHSCEVKLLAYADDVVLVCSNKPSIENAMSRVSHFCTVSGAAVNNDKRPFCIPVDYRIVLPTSPTGDKGKNQVYLHCDVNARPIRIVDFKELLEKADLRKDVAGLGVCQMGHVWLCSLKSAAAKERLLQLGRLTVKGKLCVPVDPNRQKVRAKLHWVPFDVSNDTLRRALEEYGTVHEVTKEKWRVEGFEDIESTTRIAKLTLKEGKTPENLHHDNNRTEATVQDEKRTVTASSKTRCRRQRLENLHRRQWR